jgi:hypothetical protein
MGGFVYTNTDTQQVTTKIYQSFGFILHTDININCMIYNKLKK